MHYRQKVNTLKEVDIRTNIAEVRSVNLIDTLLKSACLLVGSVYQILQLLRLGCFTVLLVLKSALLVGFDLIHQLLLQRP
jgi:hypothetical protein